MKKDIQNKCKGKKKKMKMKKVMMSKNSTHEKPIIRKVILRRRDG